MQIKSLRHKIVHPKNRKYYEPSKEEAKEMREIVDKFNNELRELIHEFKLKQ